MENQRLILFLALSLVVFMLWQAWESDHAPRTANAPTATTTAPTAVTSTPAPTEGTVVQSAAAPSTAAALQTAQRVHVTTDLLRAEIDTAGGDLRQLELLAYPLATDKPTESFRLLNDTLPNLSIVQSGVVSSTNPAPDAQAIYVAEKSEYKLPEGANDLAVRLQWTHPDGVNVIKTYTFHRDSYLVDAKIEITNNSGKEWKGRLYRQLQRTKVAEAGQSSFVYTFMGGVVSSPYNKYEKIEFKNMAEWKPQDSFVSGGWAAMVQHYFVSAWLAPQDQSNHYYTKVLDDSRYIVGYIGQEIVVAPNANTAVSAQLYSGPKEQPRLKAAAPHLELTVDYGVLTVIAEPLFWLLTHLHEFLGNWGWSIVVLTIMIKLVFYKLSETSYKSMANMRRLQPKMQQLRERYADDRQKMSQALMELYKKEKINPLGGCLPVLVQIPVFISLYWVLLESVELRQADFIFWIHDLSSKDPIYILPLLMGITMFIQQKLNPAPMDPIQQKVMMALPIVFTLFFAFFPSGLVLYWLANNVLSIAQQWYITRKIEQAAAA